MFRTKLLLALMGVVVAVTGAMLVTTQRRVLASYGQLLRSEFQRQLDYHLTLQANRLEDVKQLGNELAAWAQEGQSRPNELPPPPAPGPAGPLRDDLDHATAGATCRRSCPPTPVSWNCCGGWILRRGAAVSAGANRVVVRPRCPVSNRAGSWWWWTRPANRFWPCRPTGHKALVGAAPRSNTSASTWRAGDASSPARRWRV